MEEWEQDKLKREKNEQQSLFSWTRKTRAEKIDTIRSENKQTSKAENTNHTEEKTENTVQLDYPENTRILVIEKMEEMLQNVLEQEQEQAQTTEQPEITKKFEKLARPKITIKLKQPTLKDILRNNSSRTHNNHRCPPPTPPSKSN